MKRLDELGALFYFPTLGAFLTAIASGGGWFIFVFPSLGKSCGPIPLEVWDSSRLWKKQIDRHCRFPPETQSREAGAIATSNGTSRSMGDRLCCAKQ